MMDPPTEIEAIITKASESEITMKYDEAINILKPLLRRKMLKRLSLIQNVQVLRLMTACYRKSNKYKEALPYAKQYVELTAVGFKKYLELEKTKSIHEMHIENHRELKYPTLHLMALNESISLLILLGSFDLAYKSIDIAKMVILGSSIVIDFEYRWPVYMTLGNLELNHKKPKEALAAFDKSKIILVGGAPTTDAGHMKKIVDLADVLDKMATCHKLLYQWNEAIACYKEAINLTGDLSNEDDHIRSVYASLLFNLGCGYAKLKQYRKAITPLEISHIISLELYGDKNEVVIASAKAFLAARTFGLFNQNNDATEKRNFRMCNTCENVKEDMDICPACNHVWYCNDECQLKDWDDHKLICNWCVSCQITKDHTQKMPHCTKCKKVKYCNVECQKAHWKEHKICCIPIEKPKEIKGI